MNVNAWASKRRPGRKTYWMQLSYISAANPAELAGFSAKALRIGCNTLGRLKEWGLARQDAVPVPILLNALSECILGDPILPHLTRS
jgi:hypothetical protein